MLPNASHIERQSVCARIIFHSHFSLPVAKNHQTTISRHVHRIIHYFIMPGFTCTPSMPMQFPIYPINQRKVRIHHHNPFHRTAYLAVSNEQSQRRRIPVLEVVKISVSQSTHLISDSLARRTSKALNQSTAALRKSELSKRLLHTWLVVISSRRTSRTAQLLKLHTSSSGECVRGSLKLRVQRKEENEVACLASVRRRNVEVEDCGCVGGDGSKVLGSFCCCWGGGGYRDDEVGVLIVS